MDLLSSLKPNGNSAKSHPSSTSDSRIRNTVEKCSFLMPSSTPSLCNPTQALSPVKRPSALSHFSPTSSNSLFDSIYPLFPLKFCFLLSQRHISQIILVSLRPLLFLLPSFHSLPHPAKGKHPLMAFFLGLFCFLGHLIHLYTSFITCTRWLPSLTIGPQSVL